MAESKVPYKNCNIDEQYQAQYFGFEPKKYVNGMYNGLTGCIADRIVSMEEYFRENQEINPAEMKRGILSLKKELAKELDEDFDKFEAFVSDNVFHIPSHITLSEDRVRVKYPVINNNEKMDLTEKVALYNNSIRKAFGKSTVFSVPEDIPAPPEDTLRARRPVSRDEERQIDDKIAEYHSSIKKERYVIEALRQELKNIKAINDLCEMGEDLSGRIRLDCNKGIGDVSKEIVTKKDEMLDTLSKLKTEEVTESEDKDSDEDQKVDYYAEMKDVLQTEDDLLCKGNTKDV